MAAVSLYKKKPNKKKTTNVLLFLFMTIFFRNVWWEYKFISRPTSCLADGLVQPHALKPLINQTAAGVSWSLLSPWRASVFRLINAPEACPGFLLCITLSGHWGALKGRGEMNLNNNASESKVIYFFNVAVLVTRRSHFMTSSWDCESEYVFALTTQKERAISGKRLLLLQRSMFV